jgi:hypothetical protein
MKTLLSTALLLTLTLASQVKGGNPEEWARRVRAAVAGQPVPEVHQIEGVLRTGSERYGKAKIMSLGALSTPSVFLLPTATSTAQRTVRLQENALCYLRLRHSRS